MTNRIPEAVASEAVQEFWLAVHEKFQTSGLAVPNPLKAMGALEQQALDTAVGAMIMFMTLRTARLCAEDKAKQ